jgi:DNA-binding LacI/PurR family transcriptional regulator
VYNGSIMADAKWQIIYRDLLARITTGDLAGKSTMPTEEALSGQYHCSRPTLRVAMAELKQAGYITSIKGSGVYINARAETGPSKGRLLGVIFPNMGPGYLFDPLSNQLAQCASENGYSMVWGGYISPKSENLKLDILQICELYSVQKIEGLFFAPFEYHARMDLINEEILRVMSYADIPIVLMDANSKPYPAACDFDLVSLDHMQAAYLITGHLIEQNRKHIAFAASPNSHHSVKLRLMGCREALIDHGMGAAPVLEFSGEDLPSLSRFIKEKKTDAILCSNDYTAIGLMYSLEKLGLKVPADIAVAGFDNLSRAMSFPRSITSIEQPVRDICYAALSLMIDRRINPHKAASQMLFPGRLIIGDTTVCQ